MSDPSGPSLDRFGDTTADDVTKVGMSMNFAPMVLEEEAMAGGWTRTTSPTGGKNPPKRATTAGLRGEPGWDDDVRLGTDNVSRAHQDGFGHD